MDHHLLDSNFPSLLQYNSNCEQDVAKTPSHALMVNPHKFILMHGMSSTVHVITSISYKYVCESSVNSSESDCVIISLQNVKPNVDATKSRFAGLKKTPIPL